MKVLATGAGAALGAVVAVLTHFLSHTLPREYTIGVSQMGNRVSLQAGPPLVHPSWWPTILVAVVVGAAVGLAVAVLAGRAGVRITRTTGPRDETST